MSGILESRDSLWLAVGWTMLHVLWSGAAIGAVATVAARASRRASPETRYLIALLFLAALGLSPFVIFARVYQPPITGTPFTTDESVKQDIASSVKHDTTFTPILPLTRVTAEPVVRSPGGTRFEPLVALLPWVWMIGTSLTLTSLAAGLFGVERLRRSSRRVAGSDIEDRCRVLAASLKIARRVSVGVCDRLAGPILIGVIRPLILLPSAALSGWTPGELEMVLLHELAHVRRWDNLVNILQRVIEALLFFHPAAWWLSAWVRLERELACDRLVVGRVGEPLDYAEMLLLMATSRRPDRGVASALADRQTATRIRLLLNRGDRSMKLTMPEGLGLAGALFVAALMAFGTRASDPPADAKDREIAQALAQAAADLVTLPLEPSKGMSKPSAMINLAEAQLAVGDKAGAQATFKTLTASFGAADRNLDSLGSLIPLAQAQRKAGDVAGAGATLNWVREQVGLLNNKAILSEMNKNILASDVKGDQQHALPADSDIPGEMMRCMILFMIADEWVELGDRPQAIAIARDALKIVKPDTVSPKAAATGRTDPNAVKASLNNDIISMKVATLGFLGMLQHKAGDLDSRNTLTEALQLAGTLTIPKDRTEALTGVVLFLSASGEIDQAIEVARALEPGAKPEAFRQMVEALTDDHPGNAWLDPAGIKITMGADTFTLKNPEMALRSLSKIIPAVRSSVGPLQQARLFTMIAHLQAKGGDFAAARETALSIPAVKRADFPGLADGFYDAIKPVTLALVAKEWSKADPAKNAHGEAKDLFQQAAAMARAVVTPEQKTVAMIAIAQAAKGIEQGLANTMIGEANTVAMGLKEPVRSRALTLVVDHQVDAGELAVAALTAHAIRDYPGLEKHRALTKIANEWDKRGNKEMARELRRKGIVYLENGPPPNAKAQMGKVREMRSFSAHSYEDFESEFEIMMSDYHRKIAASFARAKLVDQADAMEAARKLPLDQRDITLANLVGQVARDGKPIEALKLAKTLETPAQRLTAIELIATAIRDSRTAK